MGKFVVDTSTVLHLAASRTGVSSKHSLEAPTLLRSQVLSALYEAVRRSDFSATEAHERRTWIRKLPIRLLGDAVLQRRAWEVAQQLGWGDTYDAEYVALAQLHRATLVTLNEELAQSVQGIVPTASIDALR